MTKYKKLLAQMIRTYFFYLELTIILESDIQVIITYKICSRTKTVITHRGCTKTQIKVIP